MNGCRPYRLPGGRMMDTLPTSDDKGPHMNNPLPALRGMLLISLAIIFAACATTTRSPAPTPSAAATGTGVATAAATAAGGGACSPEDLALTGGSWGAAAGSRGAEVSVENRGSAACTLPAGPSVAILDAGGTAIVESDPPADEPGPALEPGAVTTFTILFSNWCEEATALPLHVLLRAGSTGIAIPGLDMTADDLPPCNGPGQPATLSANPWQPVN
jgi:Protein of unknown function (DUF4232)